MRYKVYLLKSKKHVGMENNLKRRYKLFLMLSIISLKYMTHMRCRMLDREKEWQ